MVYMTYFFSFSYNLPAPIHKIEHDFAEFRIN